MRAPRRTDRGTWHTRGAAQDRRLLQEAARDAEITIFQNINYQQSRGHITVASAFFTLTVAEVKASAAPSQIVSTNSIAACCGGQRPPLLFSFK